MFENNQSNGLFRLRPNKSEGKDKRPPRSKYEQLTLALLVVIVLLYPFALVGVIPLLIGLVVDKKDRDAHVSDREYQGFLKRGSPFFSVSFAVFTLLNVWCFVSFLPRGYLSSYLLFPLNLLDTTLQFDGQTVVALLLGGCAMGSGFLAFASFTAKRKVISKEAQREKITKSKKYKKRREEKFEVSQAFTDDYEMAYENALENNDFAEYERLKETLLLGTSEFGLPYTMNLKEFNQHGLLPATTGAGKTVFLQLLVQHAAKFNIPLLLIDGKGAMDTLQAMKDVAGYYGKTVHVFNDDSEEGHLRYNPIKYGNETSIRDKLVTLAETESVYYSSDSKSLIQSTIQLIDTFSYRKDVQRTFKHFQYLLLPRNVLKLFGEQILVRKPTLYELEVETEVSKKRRKEAEKNAAKEKKKVEKKAEKKAIVDTEIEEEDQSEPSKETSIDEEIEEAGSEEALLPETEIVKLNPDTMELESLYWLLKRHLVYLSKNEQVMFERLFVRYEHKSNPFYLYAVSEALQTNINMLMDSQLGELFVPKTDEEELDVQKIARRGDIVYVSLNGLIYHEYIHTIAQLLIGDINYYASEMYRKGQVKPFLVLFDEPSAYLNQEFIDLVNKGRGIGIHALFSPQTMADIEILGDKLDKRLIGNVNTVILGKTNDANEVDYWSKKIGTYSDIELTTMTEQEAGYSDVERTDWAGERGTQRNVEKFIVSPNTIKSLRTGEFIVVRTATEEEVPTQIVYVRNAAKWIADRK